MASEFRIRRVLQHLDAMERVAASGRPFLLHEVSYNLSGWPSLLQVMLDEAETILPD